MPTEGIANQPEQNLSPFLIEQIEPIHVPKVEIKEHQLFIDGEIRDKYEHVEDQKPQKNNPNLLYFQASNKDNKEKENYAGRVIDLKNPDQELLNVRIDDKKNTFVNGVEWDSLRGRNVYWGGHRAEIDPEAKKIVFWASEGDESKRSGNAFSVIVNNQVWNTKFDSISTASSNGGIAYAFGGSKNANKLVIEDKEWIYDRFENKEYSNDIDQISDARVSKSGKVVAIIDSTRLDNETRRYISVGDTAGEKYVWKNTFDKKPDLIILDDESDHIAVFGQAENNGKTGLLIDDIPYDIQGNPKTLEYMKFENGSLVIQYDNALGEKVSERISLREDSREVQEAKNKKEAQEKMFEELRRLLASEKISVSEIIDRLKKGNEFEKQAEEIKTLKSQINSLEAEKIKFESEFAEQQKNLNEEIKKQQIRVKDAETGLKKIEKILEGATKITMGSGRKLSQDNIDLARSIIDDQRNKYNWPTSTEE